MKKGETIMKKEIRERYNIHENDYLEFLLDSDGFFIRKYSFIDELSLL